MHTATITYLGNLRTEATHIRSGETLITDAPLDNQGCGEAFSPTDLLSTALASCMITLMGIAARTKEIPLEGVSAKVFKHMAAAPRRVERIRIEMRMNGALLGDRERTILEHAARTCPVALSLKDDLVQEIEFVYE